MDRITPLEPVELNLVFEMIVVVKATLNPCEVYFARLPDGSTFTRVIMNPGVIDNERVIDVDRWEEGWVDLHAGEATVWSELVANSLDYHIIQYNAKKNNKPE